MDQISLQHIISKSDVFSGSPHISGHRIRVMDIVVWHEKRGFSPDQIVDIFPGITLADVYAALVYYFDHRQDIEAEIQGESKRLSDIKPQYPSKLRQKIGE